MNLMKKPHIGLFIDHFYPLIDGIVVVVDHYARYLSLYADVTVFAPYTKKQDQINDLPYRVYYVKHMKMPFLSKAFIFPMNDFFFYQAIKQSKLDLIHIHSFFSIGKMGAQFGHKHKIPVVSTLHVKPSYDIRHQKISEHMTSTDIQKRIHMLNQCDEIWAVNNYVSQLYIEQGLNQEPVIMPHATDMIYVSDTRMIANLKKKYTIEPDEKILLYVGRFDERKNLGFLIESLYRLRIKGFKFKMIFVGTGLYEKEMQRLIKKYGLIDRVIFVSQLVNRNELALHFRVADLFLFPSIDDTSSLVQIEAASQKTPTLFLKNTSTAATIIDQVNGYVSEHDANQYAQTIIHIFQQYKQYLKVKEQCHKDLYLTWTDVSHKVYMRYLKIIQHQEKKS